MRKPFAVCAVADLDGAGTIDRADHLACYQVSDASGQAPFAPRDVTVADRFGAPTFTAKKAATVCVPTTVSEP